MSIVISPKITISNKAVYTFIVIVVLLICSGLIYAWQSNNPQIHGHTVDEIKHTSQKLCSAYHPNEWRDSIIVPQDWSAETCQQWGTFQGAGVNYQLGCVFENSYSWGEYGLPIGTTGSLPNPNCGW